MKQNLTTYFLGAILMYMVGCTGYNDGPAISFAAAENKLVNTWGIDEATRNGSDISAEYAEELFRFQENGDFERLERTLIIDIPPAGRSVESDLGEGSWFFRNNKSQVEVIYTYTFSDPINAAVQYQRTQNELWTIDRLTPEELWLSDDSTSLKMSLYTP